MKCKRICCLGALCLLAAVMLSVPLLLRAGATAADEQEKELLGTLSQSYEAGSPGAISTGSGDAGGKSYGSYQFSSGSDIPKKFFEWCQKSEDTYYRSIGDRLSSAYYDGTPGYGAGFDAEWKALAKENKAGFEQAQRNYVRLRYYDPIIKRLEENISGFDIDNYSIALRNVLWSRAVQLGVGGAESMMNYAVESLGGFANQRESDLIRAIYADCAEVRMPEEGEEPMTGTSAEKYGVSGKVLSWFCGSSGDVQLGVYIRLAINEPAKAQQMLATYGYVDAPLDEGVYQLAPAANSELAATVKGSSALLAALSDSEDQRFRLTYYASGYYTITHEATGQRLIAKDDGTVALAKPSTAHRQMWKLERLESGFSLCNRKTEQYLSLASVASGEKVLTGSEAMQWQLAKAGTSWSLDGASYPTYASGLHVDDSSFPFRGTLRCDYPIQTVKVRVLKDDGSDAFSPATARDINSKSYNLARLDNKVAFSRLTAGSYTLVIEATSDAPSDSTFRLESAFYVSDGTYLVTFDPCGGTVDPATLRVSAGQAYGDLPEASKSGYIFAGWFTAAEDGTEVTPADTATAADITLYAHYKKAYSYTFRNYDGSNLAYGELAKGEVIPAPKETPSRPADKTHYYTFLGWDGYTEGMTISEDIVFEALYESHELELLQEITTDAYVIRDELLRAIAAGTTVVSLQENLAPSEYITIHKGSAASTELVGTGMTVEYAVNGEVIQTLTVVVTGDTSGDGKCSVTDMVQLQSHLLGKNTLSGAALEAADVSGDGKVTITDMVQITAVLLGRSTIQPN